MRSTIWLVLVIAFWCQPSIHPLSATLVVDSTSYNYSQNFDTLASMDMLNPWANDSTLTGWSLFRVTSASDATPVAVTSYDADDGTFNNGRFYSFGTAGSSDRALGGIGHPNFAGQTGLDATFGHIVGWMAVSFTNDSGVALDSFTVSYNGEQWLDGGTNMGEPAQTMVFEYGFGADFGSVSMWTSLGGNFDWPAPVNGPASAPVNGNSAGAGGGLVGGRGGSQSGLAWQDGQTLWLRWIERNDAGADHGMAIDNFSFSVGSSAAVPEPGAPLFWAGLLAALVVVRAGCRLVTYTTPCGATPHAPERGR